MTLAYGWARRSLSPACSPVCTWATYGASSAATAPTPWPRTRPCTVPPTFWAAATTCRTPLESLPLAWSATMRWVAMSDHLRFGVELLHEGGDVGDLLAGLLLGRLLVALHDDAGRHVGPEA